jgi:hypothetical protein
VSVVGCCTVEYCTQHSASRLPSTKHHLPGHYCPSLVEPRKRCSGKNRRPKNQSSGRPGFVPTHLCRAATVSKLKCVLYVLVTSKRGSDKNRRYRNLRTYCCREDRTRTVLICIVPQSSEPATVNASLLANKVCTPFSFPTLVPQTCVCAFSSTRTGLVSAASLAKLSQFQNCTRNKASLFSFVFPSQTRP